MHNFKVIASIVIFLISSLNLTAQSIWVTTPANGATVSGSAFGSTPTTIPVSFQFNHTNTELPPVLYEGIKLRIVGGLVYDTRNGEEIPQWFYFTPGSYQFILELYEHFAGPDWFLTASCTTNFNVKHTISVMNNFSGGQVSIDGQNKTAGSSTFKFSNENLSVGAVDQFNSSYNWTWNTSAYSPSNWSRQGMGQGGYSALSGATTRTYNYSVRSDDNGARIMANMKKICNLNFQATAPSTITAPGGPYGSSATVQIVEQNPVMALASNYTSNGINFVFHHWLDNTGQIVNPPFSPTAHNNYTAVYTGYPVHTNRNLASPSQIGQPITLTWTDHPNPAVTYYQVWVMITHDGVQTANYIADVNRGVQTFTDQTFTKTGKDVGYKLAYDVRAVYPPDGTTTTPNYIPTIYGEILEKQLITEDAVIPVENKLYDNFPNPFNPSTQIKFALKEDSYVSLKVYDILGKEVKTLVSENISAGTYTYDFDGNDLPSGLYIYSLSTKDYNATKKMMLTK